MWFIQIFTELRTTENVNSLHFLVSGFRNHMAEGTKAHPGRHYNNSWHFQCVLLGKQMSFSIPKTYKTKQGWIHDMVNTKAHLYTID